MKVSHRQSGWAMLALLIAGALLGGCSTPMVITQIPEFYTPDLKYVAVVPFRSEVPDKPNAGTSISENVTRAFMGTGTYNVSGSQDLAALENQRDLMIYAKGGDAGAMAMKLKNLKNLQAILVGTVTTYSATSMSQPRTEPQYAYDRNGNQYLVGYRSYVFTRNDANVVVSAALIRVSDGTTIYSTRMPIKGTSWAEGSPPPMDPEGCLSSAAADAVAGLTSTFCITRREIRVNPSKQFNTATSLYDGKWECTDKLKATSGKAFLVLALPACCDRNRFRMTIVRKDQREDLADIPVVWQRDFPARGQGFEFSPAKVAANGGGGNFTAKFYSGEQVVMTHDFRIE